MINKLRKRFVIIGTLSVFVFLLIVVTTINIINYKAMINDIDRTVEVVANPKANFFKEFEKPIEPRKEFEEFLPNDMSPEVPFETRFFSVLIDDSNQIQDADISRIITVTSEEIINYVTKATKSSSDKGFIDEFRYKKISEDDLTRIVFVDCGRKIDSFYNFMLISSLTAFVGCILICGLFILVSKKVVSPIVENQNKQKTFITNAGHEIKTPLTIISANTDLLEMEIGNNESINDIRKQTVRLKDLTNKLVYLAKLNENSDEIIKTDLPLSEVLNNVIENFSSIIQQKDINLSLNIEKLVSIVGEQKSIEELFNILLDNAIKYTEDNGNISISLSSNSKKVYFSISNTTKEQIDEESLRNIFERFYRVDKSRNSRIKGFGIGLSVARTITEQHNGEISAKINENKQFEIDIIFKK